MTWLSQQGITTSTKMNHINYSGSRPTTATLNGQSQIEIHPCLARTQGSNLEKFRMQHITGINWTIARYRSKWIAYIQTLTKPATLKTTSETGATSATANEHCLEDWSWNNNIASAAEEKQPAAAPTNLGIWDGYRNTTQQQKPNSSSNSTISNLRLDQAQIQKQTDHTNIFAITTMWITPVDIFLPWSVWAVSAIILHKG